MHRGPELVPLFVTLAVSVLLGQGGLAPAVPRHEEARWSVPVVVSDGSAWFPDAAVDAEERIHVVWSAGEGLRYRQRAGGAWSTPLDVSDRVLAPQPGVGDLVRSSIAIDRRTGTLHLVGATLGRGMPIHARAPARSAAAVDAWSEPQAIGLSGNGYYTAVAADSRGHVHAAYIERPPGAIPADVFYRRSLDGGRTWQAPVNLSNSPRVGGSRPQVMVGADDEVHVTWDEGWDRISGQGGIATSVYRMSEDGSRWSSPATFGWAGTPSAQLVVAAPGEGRPPIAVWRSTDEPIRYQVSTGRDGVWSAPAGVPGVVARTWNSPPFDQYALLPDVHGAVHLAMVGRVIGAPDDALQVLHLVWNGATWSEPVVVFNAGPRFPEYPRLSTGSGALALVWFARTDLWDSLAHKDVWFSELR